MFRKCTLLQLGLKGKKETEGERKSSRPTGLTCIPAGPAKRRTKYLPPDTIDTNSP